MSPAARLPANTTLPKALLSRPLVLSRSPAPLILIPIFYKIGNLTGATSWQTSGKQEHAEGEAEYKAAQAQGYVEGTADRAGGYKDNVVGALTGDKTKQAAGMFTSASGSNIT